MDAQVSGNAIPLFSLAGSEILRLLIENKRHAALDKILTDSQPAIEGYSKKCLSLLLILDQSLASDYDAKAGLLDEEFYKVSNGKPTDDPKARAVVERYEAVVKLLVEGANHEPFRAKMMPPLENRVGRRDKLIACSRERFAMPRLPLHTVFDHLNPMCIELA